MTTYIHPDGTHVGTTSIPGEIATWHESADGPATGCTSVRLGLPRSTPLTLTRSACGWMRRRAASSRQTTAAIEQALS